MYVDVELSLTTRSTIRTETNFQGVCLKSTVCMDLEIGAFRSFRTLLESVLGCMDCTNFYIMCFYGATAVYIPFPIRLCLG